MMCKNEFSHVCFHQGWKIWGKKDPTRFPLIGDGECVKTTQDWPWTGHVVSETGRRTRSLVQAQVKQMVYAAEPNQCRHHLPHDQGRCTRA